MSGIDERRAEVLGLFAPVARIARTQQADEVLERLAEAERRLAEGQLVTVVCGEFKRGKSTLVGALLEDPELFPADVDVATSTVSAVRYGEEEEVVVTLGEGEEVTTETIERHQLGAYVSEQGNPRNARQVRLVEIATPNAKLASGLMLVDTPGIGSAHESHTAATYAFLPRADAVVFVSDVTRPLLASELAFVRRVHEHCDTLLFVVTMTDLRSDEDSLLDRTRETLAELTGLEPGDLPLVAVSSLAKLNHLQSGDAEDLAFSNFPALEKALWSILDRRGELLITRALAELERSVEALLQPLEAEREASREQTQERLDELTGDLEGRRARTAELRQRGAEWRHHLRTRMDGLTEATTRFRKGIRAINRRVSTVYLHDEQMLRKPEALFDAVNADLSLLVGGISEWMDQQASAIHNELTERTGLALEVTALEDLGDVTLDPAGVDALPQKTPLRNFLRKLRESYFPGLILGGAAAGAVTLVGLPYLAPIVGLGPGIVGYREAAKAIKEQDRQRRSAALKRLVDDALAEVVPEIEGSLGGSLRGFGRSIEFEFERKLALEADSLDRSLKGLAESRQRTAAELGERLRQLEAPIATLRRTRQRVRDLGAREGDAPAVQGHSDDGSFADDG